VIRILFIGDIVGSPGRGLVRDLLAPFREERAVNFVVANGENAAGGRGLTPAVAADLFKSGVDVLTSGNHIWKNRDILEIIDKDPRILRPANYPDDPAIPGHGCDDYEIPGANCRIGVLNLQGRAFMEPIDCPFRLGRELVQRIRKTTPIILVDFHAEATSEKLALLWHLDGLVTAVIGTHTHVPTADEMVTPSGTAYQTDAGMTGPFDGVLGVRKDVILHGMITHMPVRHELAEGDLRLCGLLVEADRKTGRATAVERVCLKQNQG
jgi:2',3'-cyclic-nucleotide 2'-phosphodiesterase